MAKVETAIRLGGQPMNKRRQLGKCSCCGETSGKFWDYKDRTKLCSGCHGQIGKKWKGKESLQRIERNNGASYFVQSLPWNVFKKRVCPKCNKELTIMIFLFGFWPPENWAQWYEGTRKCPHCKALLNLKGELLKID